MVTTATMKLAEHATLRKRSTGARDSVLIDAVRCEVAGLSHAPDVPRRIPTAIGPYRILRRLGEGGMGVVYEGEQTHPTRRVALKVMRDGTGDRYRIRSFQREIEALARLQHPGIARIYHADHTPDGQPYFVMELIEGESIVDHCRAERCTVRHRLARFVRVCRAVHHAHQRGVIHRDLKPSNILVDVGGDPHVLDFGLARFSASEMDVTRSVGAGRALVGTLAYMSPEQARGDAWEVDTRTDVYSLGVVLYELLTGRQPYDVTGSLSDVLKNIIEDEPIRPSRVSRDVNHEIETIVLRALAKDPSHRYPSAEALAADIERYLEGKPIDAKRDSVCYVLRKLAARHRLATTTIALLIVTTIGFSGVSFHWFYQARRAQVASEADRGELAQRLERIQSYGPKRLVDAFRYYRRVTFGRFLLAWHDNRIDTADAIRESLPAASEERSAADFLLDASPLKERIETFRTRIASVDAALWRFVLAEQYLRAGQLQEAHALYARCPTTSDALTQRKLGDPNAVHWVRHRCWLELLAQSDLRPDA